MAVEAIISECCYSVKKVKNSTFYTKTSVIASVIITFASVSEVYDNIFFFLELSPEREVKSYDGPSVRRKESHIVNRR